MSLRVLTLQSDLEKIRAFIESPSDNTRLTPALESKLADIELCRFLISEDKAKYEIIFELASGLNCTQQTARRIYNETVEIYDPRQIKIERLFKNLAETRALAIAKDDQKAAANADRNYINAIEKFFPSDAEKRAKEYEGAVVVIGHFPEELKTELPSEHTLMTFVNKIRQIGQKEPVATDIEHEDAEDSPNVII